MFDAILNWFNWLAGTALNSLIGHTQIVDARDELVLSCKVTPPVLLV
jgi:hypothetical protein